MMNLIKHELELILELMQLVAKETCLLCYHCSRRVSVSRALPGGEGRVVEVSTQWPAVTTLQSTFLIKSLVSLLIWTLELLCRSWGCRDIQLDDQKDLTEGRVPEVHKEMITKPLQ